MNMFILSGLKCYFYLSLVAVEVVFPA